MMELARRVYLAARKGEWDAEPILELALALYECCRDRPAARELLERPWGTFGEAELRSLTGRLLDEAAFEPGFDLEPGRWDTLEEALAIVERDVRSAGIRGPLGLVIPEWDHLGHARVEFRGHPCGPSIGPVSGEDLHIAVETVAEAVQEVVMETIWGVWPTCAEHSLGLRSARVDGRSVWTCAASGGHVAAAMGDLPPG